MAGRRRRASRRNADRGAGTRFRLGGRIALIGVFETTQALPRLIGAPNGMQEHLKTISLQVLEKDLIPHLPQSAIGLFLALKPGVFATRIART